MASVVTHAASKQGTTQMTAFQKNDRITFGSQQAAGSGRRAARRGPRVPTAYCTPPTALGPFLVFLGVDSDDAAFEDADLRLAAPEDHLVVVLDALDHADDARAGHDLVILL